jgi:hypothetical protein
LIVDQWPGAVAGFLEDCRLSLEQMLKAKGDIDRHEIEPKSSKKSKIVQV